MLETDGGFSENISRAYRRIQRKIKRRRKGADYTTFLWRVAKVKVVIDLGVVIPVDSTGIKVSNRREWTKERWNSSKRKGFIKFHIAIDTRTGKILAIDVTKENVSDGAKTIPLKFSLKKSR